MSAKPLAAAPPQVSQPIVNADGTPTSSFFRLLQAMWSRGGGATGQLVGFTNTDGSVVSSANIAMVIIEEIGLDPALLMQLAALVLGPGFMLPFGGPVPLIPAGWLLCNGAAVSRAAFPGLFKAIGTHFGPGDGLTTFNLPNAPADLPWNANLRLLPILATLNWCIRT